MTSSRAAIDSRSARSSALAAATGRPAPSILCRRALPRYAVAARARPPVQTRCAFLAARPRLGSKGSRPPRTRLNPQGPGHPASGFVQRDPMRTAAGAPRARPQRPSSAALRIRTLLIIGRRLAANFSYASRSSPRLSKLHHPRWRRARHSPKSGASTKPATVRLHDRFCRTCGRRHPANRRWVPHGLEDPRAVDLGRTTLESRDACLAHEVPRGGLDVEHPTLPIWCTRRAKAWSHYSSQARAALNSPDSTRRAPCEGRAPSARPAAPRDRCGRAATSPWPGTRFEARARVQPRSSRRLAVSGASHGTTGPTRLRRPGPGASIDFRPRPSATRSRASASR